jgi:hypothetical protein
MGVWPGLCFGLDAEQCVCVIQISKGNKPTEHVDFNLVACSLFSLYCT